MTTTFATALLAALAGHPRTLCTCPRPTGARHRCLPCTCGGGNCDACLIEDDTAARRREDR